MIIVMGFSLPSAMGIYWFLGALISIGQTYITRKVMAKNK
jgi:membrane protein insertase Oxa1/YidC/SpoIIIJ